MKQAIQILARAALLAALVLAAPLAAQQRASQGSGPPLESLVLVLNLISSTHARPATGVVLGDSARPGHALVLVPASFVQAGDEIIVLDGGNDILRNGRPTRTVARSAGAGVAVLEVEGLARPGVSLAGESWNDPASGTYEFAAWPGAQALAEGAALIRQIVQPNEGLPGLSGPLFDQCGYLAAMHIHGDDVRTTGGPELAQFLEDFEIEFVQLNCHEAMPAIESQVPANESGTEQRADDADDKPAARTEAPPTGKLSDLAPSPRQRTGLLISWVVLGILAFLLYLRRQKRRRPKPVVLVLERRTGSGQRFHHTIKLDPAHGSGQFERNGLVLIIRRLNSGFEVGIAENENLRRVDLLIGSTPCQGGEKFIIGPGQEFQLGGERFVLIEDVDQHTANRIT